MIAEQLARKIHDWYRQFEESQGKDVRVLPFDESIQRPAYTSPARPTPSDMTLRDWFAGQMLAAMLGTQTLQEQLELAIRKEHERKRGFA